MNQEMRTSMDSSQLSIQDLTQEQFRQISQYDKIKETGYTIFLSVAENEELQTISTEIRYADENGARSYQCLPTQGTLPQGEKEAAVSTIILDLLGVPHKIGSTVTLTYSASGETDYRRFPAQRFLGRRSPANGPDGVGFQRLLSGPYENRHRGVHCNGRF